MSFNRHISSKGLFFLTLFSACIFTSCKKDEISVDPIKFPSSYEVPTTYNFESADFSSSTQRITMLGEITSYIRTTHSETEAPVLDALKLKDMYSNLNNRFADAALNTSGIQLKDQTGTAFNLPQELEDSFGDAVIASQNAATSPTSSTASNGTPGKLITGTRFVLVDENGIEYKEFAEKGIMAGVFYYQATTILHNINSFDNTTVTNGTTAQERAWDEAFGYFGVPVDFPANTTGLKNWGSYCNSMSNSLSGTPTVNTTIMNAWIKGRAAISNNDPEGRDAARDVVVATWEKVCAARFITYVKGAKANISAIASFSHNLSEAVGFIRAFGYNPNKTISDSDIEILLNYFKTSGVINIYTIPTENLDSAINKMATLFNLNADLL